MKKVNITEVKESLNKLLDSIDKEQIIVEKEGKAIATIVDYEDWKRLKQLEIELTHENEDEEEYFTPEEIIAEYNQIHGTEFTIDLLK